MIQVSLLFYPLQCYLNIENNCKGKDSAGLHSVSDLGQNHKLCSNEIVCIVSFQCVYVYGISTPKSHFQGNFHQALSGPDPT